MSNFPLWWIEQVPGTNWMWYFCPFYLNFENIYFLRNPKSALNVNISISFLWFHFGSILSKRHCMCTLESTQTKGQAITKVNLCLLIKYLSTESEPQNSVAIVKKGTQLRELFLQIILLSPLSKSNGFNWLNIFCDICLFLFLFFKLR